MRNSREHLQEFLEEMLGSDNVLFEPPENVKLSYPCILFKRDNIDNTFANNNVYNQQYSYQVTIIEYDIDTELVDKFTKLTNCKFDRTYSMGDLVHTVFTMYYK